MRAYVIHFSLKKLDWGLNAKYFDAKCKVRSTCCAEDNSQVKTARTV